ncbi:hypothetical protein V6N13_003368 [Hibiscus sabdariffa]
MKSIETTCSKFKSCQMACPHVSVDRTVPPGFVKINSDASVDLARCRAGIIVVIRDCDGHTVASSSTFFFIKAKALQLGLNCATSFSFWNIICESHNVGLIKKLS